MLSDAYTGSRKDAACSKAPAIPEDLQAMRCEESHGRREVPQMPKQGAPPQEARAEALEASKIGRFFY